MREHPQVQQAVDALNAGKVSCPNGVCIVRSEKQQLKFVIARSDKVGDYVDTPRDALTMETPRLNKRGLDAPASEDFGGDFRSILSSKSSSGMDVGPIPSRQETELRRVLSRHRSGTTFESAPEKSSADARTTPVEEELVEAETKVAVKRSLMKADVDEAK